MAINGISSREPLSNKSSEGDKLPSISENPQLSSDQAVKNCWASVQRRFNQMVDLKVKHPPSSDTTQSDQ